MVENLCFIYCVGENVDEQLATNFLHKNRTFTRVKPIPFPGIQPDNDEINLILLGASQ